MLRRESTAHVFSHPSVTLMSLLLRASEASRDDRRSTRIGGSPPLSHVMLNGKQMSRRQRNTANGQTSKRSSNAMMHGARKEHDTAGDHKVMSRPPYQHRSQSFSCSYLPPSASTAARPINPVEPMPPSCVYAARFGT